MTKTASTRKKIAAKQAKSASVVTNLSQNIAAQSSPPIAFFTGTVQAGFPSPADDHPSISLNLHDLLIKRPAATFMVRAAGDSMIQAGIHAGDLLIVDRSIEAHDGHVVLAVVDGQFTVKTLRRKNQRIELHAAHPDYKVIRISPDQQFEVWGVVIHVIHSLLPRSDVQ